MSSIVPPSASCLVKYVTVGFCDLPIVCVPTAESVVEWVGQELVVAEAAAASEKEAG
ncbi:MAG: hypothetical protein L0H94_08155 [Nitrospira sp.]|nr:hypothetical protein [Nitrospira sp.]